MEIFKILVWFVVEGVFERGNGVDRLNFDSIQFMDMHILEMFGDYDISSTVIYV